MDFRMETRGWEIEVVMSGHRSRAVDSRTTVVIREQRTPWPVRFHFLRLEEDDGAVEWRNVGFEIGDRFDDLEDGAAVDPLAMDQVAVERVVSRYHEYLQVAERMIVLDRDGIEGALRLLRGHGVKPAKLTDDFYRLIAADYSQRRRSGVTAPLQRLADAQNVDKSTASRWVKEATRRGYLTKEES